MDKPRNVCRWQKRKKIFPSLLDLAVIRQYVFSRFKLETSIFTFSRASLPTKLHNTCDYMAYAIFSTTQFRILYYIFDTPQMISNKKSCSCKVLDPIEQYNFNVDFVSVWHCYVHAKSWYQSISSLTKLFGESKHLKFDQIKERNTKIYDIKYVCYENITNEESNDTYLVW